METKEKGQKRGTPKGTEDETGTWIGGTEREIETCKETTTDTENWKGMDMEIGIENGTRAEIENRKWIGTTRKIMAEVEAGTEKEIIDGNQRGKGVKKE